MEPSVLQQNESTNRLERKMFPVKAPSVLDLPIHKEETYFHSEWLFESGDNEEGEYVRCTCVSGCADVCEWGCARVTPGLHDGQSTSTETAGHHTNHQDILQALFLTNFVEIVISRASPG